MNDEIRKSLGLSAAELGTVSALPPGGDEAAQGLVREAALAFCLVSSPLSDGGFHPSPLEAAREVGFEYASGSGQARGQIRLRTTDGTPFCEVRTTEGLAPRGGAPSDLVLFDDEDPGTVYLRASSGPAVVIAEDGRGLFLDPETRESQAVLSLFGPPPIAALTAPVVDWMKDREDSWLAAALAARVARTDTYSQAAAVALHDRAVIPSDVDRDRMRRFLAGEDVDIDPPSRHWVRGLSRAQISSVESLAISEAQAWQYRVERLGLDMEVFDEGWRVELLAFLHARDDLEGIGSLLAEVGCHDALRGVLQVLDRLARPFVTSLPGDLFSGDERLRRAALHPESWWAHPATA